MDHELEALLFDGALDGQQLFILKVKYGALYRFRAVPAALCDLLLLYPTVWRLRFERRYGL